MLERDLNLNYHLKKDRFEQESRTLHQGERQRIEDTARAAKSASDKNIANIVEQKRAQDMATSSIGAMTAGVGTLAAAFAGMAGRQMFEALTKATIDSHRQLEKYAIEFLKIRDAGRELAGIMGRSANNQFTQEQLQFGKLTGQNPEEVRDFRTTFRGEAQQFASRFAPGEFEKYEQAIGRLQVKEGLEADVSGTLGAQGIRLMPKGALGLRAEDVLKRTETGFATLQAGSGSNPVLSRQYSKIIAGGVGEGQFFRDESQAAVAIRTQAQYSAASAGMHLQAIQRDIDKLDDRQRAALGLTDGQDYFQSMNAINATYRKSGMPSLSKFLIRNGINDDRAIRGIRTHFNEGIEGGVIAKGFDDARNVDIGQYQRETESFFGDSDSAGSLRIEQAKTRALEGQVAKNREKLASVLEEGNRRTLRRRIDPVGRFINNYMPTGMTFGWYGYENADQLLQYGGAISAVEGRARQAGVPFESMMNSNNLTQLPAYMTTDINKVEEKLVKLIEVTEQTNKILEQSKAPKPLGPGGPPTMPSRPR